MKNDLLLEEAIGIKKFIKNNRGYTEKDCLNMLEIDERYCGAMICELVEYVNDELRQTGKV